MDNAIIYKHLKHFINDDIVTSDDLLRMSCYRKYNSADITQLINDLHSLGFVAATKKNGCINVQITSKGKNFYHDCKYLKRLTKKEKWVERFIGFVLGVLTSVVSGVLLQLF